MSFCLFGGRGFAEPAGIIRAMKPFAFYVLYNFRGMRYNGKRREAHKGAMDTVKIGKFLAELRRERELTQEQLAEKLGISNKTISRWENGNYMPPVEMLMELSEFYGVSINELLSGKRLEQHEEKQAAEKNLKEVLTVSAFTVEERKKYFTKKWKKEHSFELTILMLTCLAVVIIGFYLDELIIILAGEFGSFAAGIINYNRMMAYVEKNAFDLKNNEDDKKS